MNSFLQRLQEVVQATDLKWLGSAVVILIVMLIRFVILQLMKTKIKDVRNRYLWREWVNYCALLISLFLIIRIWFEWFQSLLTLLSVIAAALTITSKELILNGLSYGVIVWRGLFSLGDRIQIGDDIGDVIDIGVFYFTLAEASSAHQGAESTGRSVKIPNAKVLTLSVANYSRCKNLIWNEIKLKLSSSANWEKAKELALEAVQKVSLRLSEQEWRDLLGSKHEIIFQRKDPIVFIAIEDESIYLSVRYLCKFHKQRHTESLLWEAILRRFKGHEDITLAESKSSRK